MSAESRGRRWTVAKVRPDGSIATRYEAVEIPAPDGWIAVETSWIHGTVDIGYYTFEQGDRLLEYFALDRHMNAFATFRPGGEFVGWYSNITYPTKVTEREILWHDLYVDILILADGTVVVLDEDELEESGLRETQPELYDTILRERDRILEMIRERAYPFSEVDIPAT